MHRTKVVVAATALTLWAFSAGAVTVTPADAMGQVGHAAKVCGVVATANYAADTRAHPTFLTLVSPDQPNPSATLTAVIYGTDRAKFGNAPEATLSGQRICVTGFVSFFRHRPEMILSDPTQVSYFAPPNIAELR
jgi:DNA/RNA endonuclease YhcR with UshA esterase domain